MNEKTIDYKVGKQGITLKKYIAKTLEPISFLFIIGKKEKATKLKNIKAFCFLFGFVFILLAASAMILYTDLLKRGFSNFADNKQFFDFIDLSATDLTRMTTNPLYWLAFLPGIFFCLGLIGFYYYFSPEYLSEYLIKNYFVTHPVSDDESFITGKIQINSESISETSNGYSISMSWDSLDYCLVGNEIIALIFKDRRIILLGSSEEEKDFIKTCFAECKKNELLIDNFDYM